MPMQQLSSVENNFTRGLITEATGLNFPENAATSASNCIFTLIGDTIRREGINFEANGTTSNINRTNSAMSSYVWKNPGGDGNSLLIVRQVGGTLYFYNAAVATNASPISQHLLGTTISISQFVATGGTFDATIECTYADGNGYLFVYHPTCDPFVIIYNPQTVGLTANGINIRTRDFQGIQDGLDPATRPSGLSHEHQYNLANQGWTIAPPWSTQASPGGTPVVITIGSNTTFHGVTPGLTISNGTNVSIKGAVYGTNFGWVPVGSGTVQSYSGTDLTINITTWTNNPNTAAFTGGFLINPTSLGFINTFFTAETVYPSNSDVWFLFKDTTGAFNPATTAGNVSFSLGLAPKGHYITNAWTIDRSAASAIAGLSTVSTTARPTNGTWFAGRVWFTGVNASAPAMGDASAYTWTENIYFSQIIQDTSQFGTCYQDQDPTSEFSAGLLPTDGGVIVVVGSGTIHKLFPVANGLLVFANNGVWFISGNQGIGFTADDYAITKISSIKTLSNKSFIDVLGLPFFWNEEGIYQVVPNQSGQLQVEPLTVGTILTYYNNIPLASKIYARGAYDPINYVIQWSFRSTPESSVTDRYQFDTVLNFNTYNRAFYPYDISTGTNTQFIHGIQYVSFPVITSNTPLPNFWYPCSQLVAGNYQQGFAQEYDPLFQDWGSVSYTSTFATGFKLHGQAIRRWQAPYVHIYSRNTGYAAYYIQGMWDYAINPNSSKWSNNQFTEINEANTGMAMRRHRIRGRGRVLQFQLTSVPNQPFDVMGWAVYETANASV